MAKFTGTSLNETITPDLVSASVAASPPGSKPSIGVDTVNGNGGNDTINGVGGADTLYGGDGDDTVRHWTWWDNYNDGDVTFTGTASFHGGTGNDTLGSLFDGGGLNFDAMTYRMYGEAGNDVLEATYYYPGSEWTNYGAANDYLYGGTGNDSYTVYESTDVVSEKAGEGYDLVHSWGTDYTLPANVEELRMDYVEWDTGSGFKGIGNALDNVIVGSTSRDSLYGGGGNDTIYGHSAGTYGEGNDFDTIHGGAGNDTIHGGGGNSDTWDEADTLYGDVGDDEIFGFFGDDKIYGGLGNDKLWGQSGYDTLYGGPGNDRVGGGSGFDTLYGQDGDDILSGTWDADRLNGGPGNDIYDYDDVGESPRGLSTRDIILQFEGAGVGAGDRVDLSSIDANAGVSGNQAFVLGGTGAGHVWAVGSGAADSLILADTDGGAADMEILVRGVAAGAWTAGDFIL